MPEWDDGIIDSNNMPKFDDVAILASKEPWKIETENPYEDNKFCSNKKQDRNSIDSKSIKMSVYKNIPQLNNKMPLPLLNQTKSQNSDMVISLKNMNSQFRKDKDDVFEH